jgi:hypothetical protein
VTAVPRVAPDSAGGTASFVDSLVERLHADFGVDRELIRSRATEVLATFAGAPVQSFVPILVEKALRQGCRAGARAVALG